MPDLSKKFIVECDASGSGFGAVLHQGDGVVAFFSRPIAPRHAKLAAYERELIGLVHAVRHWRPYLWGRAFLVRTDHYSLKYLLDQRLSTIPQHHWVSKLLGYDFVVQFRPGKLNTVADALSRREEDQGELASLSAPSFTLFDTLREEALNDSAYAKLRRQQANGSLGAKWGVIDGLFTYNGRIFVPPTSPSLQTILAAVHNARHEGVQKTLHRIRRDFHLQQAKKVFEDFVRTCVTCQRNNSVQLQPGGLLQLQPGGLLQSTFT
jgi:hypothetical protein